MSKHQLIICTSIPAGAEHMSMFKLGNTYNATLNHNERIYSLVDESGHTRYISVGGMMFPLGERGCIQFEVCPESEVTKKLRDVRKGDWIWTITKGWVKVTDIDVFNKYQIVTEDCMYTNTGKSHVDDQYPSVFLEPPAFFNAEPKPIEFIDGQRVMVSNIDMGANSIPRYFSHMEDGKYMCYMNGGTNWSSKGEVTSWTCCEAVGE